MRVGSWHRRAQQISIAATKYQQKTQKRTHERKIVNEANIRADHQQTRVAKPSSPGASSGEVEL